MVADSETTAQHSTAQHSTAPHCTITLMLVACCLHPPWGADSRSCKHSAAQHSIGSSPVAQRTDLLRVQRLGWLLEPAFLRWGRTGMQAAAKRAQEEGRGGRQSAGRLRAQPSHICPSVTQFARAPHDRPGQTRALLLHLHPVQTQSVHSNTPKDASDKHGCNEVGCDFLSLTEGACLHAKLYNHNSQTMALLLQAQPGQEQSVHASSNAVTSAKQGDN